MLDVCDGCGKKYGLRAGNKEIPEDAVSIEVLRKMDCGVPKMDGARWYDYCSSECFLKYFIAEECQYYDVKRSC